MKLEGEDVCIVWTGKPKPDIFRYMVYRSMSNEIAEWLQKTFKQGFGKGYYYSHNKIYFKKAKHETLFILRWSQSF
jgi:hypothetical protein